MKIICTLGPSSYKPSILKKLRLKGVDIFRINLSHTPTNEILKKINLLKKNKIKNICIDTEGAQLRTTKVKKNIYLKKNKIIKIFNNDNLSNSKNLSLSPKCKLMEYKLNKKIYVGFNNLVLKILKKNIKKNFLLAKVLTPGYLESNKGVHIDQKIKLNPLTEKDLFALDLAYKNNIQYFALSFVNSSRDVRLVKKIVGKKTFLISKIETKSAISNLNKITKESDALLIDRGDLSRYISIEKIPVAQEMIIHHGLKTKKPVYVATNLLETMIKENQPTRAESHDIFATLKQGASGLVLAAETAIGLNPVSCVDFLKRSIKIFKIYKKNEKK
jgi:pyruvate kinase